MKPTVLVLTGCLLVACLLLCGCTSESKPAPATPAPTPEKTTVPPTTVAPVAVATTSADDAPMDTLPGPQAVNLELSKDRPTSQISLLYQGGAGDTVTTKIVMHVYTSDGKYTEYVMKEGKKPIPGDEILAAGTRDGDRCVVYVYSAGKPYKVIDRKVYAMQ